MQFRDLQRQYEALHPQIDTAMKKVSASGSFIMGRCVEELEERLARYVGVKHCVTCGNGTDALYLALRVWGVGAGDAVFVPDFTFFATAEVVSLVGATPVFVDVDPNTFNLSPVDLEAKIANCSLNPKAVIAVDLFGQPADYHAIRNMVRKNHMLLLEDGAQGFGGSIDGKRACSFGDIATTSFFPAKPLGCYGDGGALFTDNDEWAEMASSLRLHGRGTEKYNNQYIGVNSRLDALQAAILQVKLDAFERFELLSVQNVADKYCHLLKDVVSVPVMPSWVASSWAQYTIRLADAGQRDGLRDALKKSGIPSQVYYPCPLHLLPAFSSLPLSVDACPNAQSLSQTVLSLPIHPYLRDDEVERVAMALKSYIYG